MAANPTLRSIVNDQTMAVLPLYETRVLQLSADVERLRSREMVKEASGRLRLQDLLLLQQQVAEQFATVEALVVKGSTLGMRLRPSESPQAAASQLPTGDLGNLDRYEASLMQMEQDSQIAMANLEQVATRSADLILAAVQRLDPEGTAILPMGGPLLQATAEEVVESAAFGNVLAALERLKAAKELVDALPVHKPIEYTRVSSGFGMREDPFTGKSAFHSGVDIPAPMGTTVASAGDGVVSFVGWRDGYGNVVEITHGSGLLSRYPHLSAFLVAEGDSVEADVPIARVGTSGRSTGPHLHFELRYNDQPLDPTPYLLTGRKLENLLT